GDPAEITPSAASGGDGTYVYQWQSKTGSGSFTNITTNGTGATYNPPSGLTVTTTYQRLVKDELCQTSWATTSGTYTVTVRPEFKAGSLSGNETICYGGDPAEITPSAATGGDGTYVYQWQSKTTGSYTNIGGATGASYNPPSGLTTTTTYQRLVKDEDCQTSWVSSGEWTVTVRPVFTAGTIASTGETICKDATPTTIGVSTAASGGDGNIHYQWYVGSTAIDGATNATFTPSDYVGAAGTYTFTRKVNDETCNTTPIASEGSWTLTVEDASVASIMASATPSTLCVGKPATLSVSATGTGTMSYEWSAGTTGASITVTPSVTTTYTVIATATTAGAGCTATASTTVTVSVETPDIAGISAGDMVWSGNAGTTAWTTDGNWISFNGTNYVAGSVPSSTTNVFLVTYGDGCSVGNPVLGGSSATKNLTIGNDKELSLGSNTISIAGNLTNNGTFTAGTGSVIFNGSTHQTISASSLTFNNVTFNNDKNFTFDGLTPIVNGSATFTSGIVTGDVTFGASASATVIDYRSYVDGTVTKTLGSSAFTFPTGSNGVLGSVTVPATRAGGSATIRFNKSADVHGYTTDEGYPRWWNINDMCTEDGANRFDHVSNAEYWDITSTATLANVTFRAVAATDVHFNDTSINEYNQEVIKFALYDGCWKNMEGSALVADGHSDLSVSNVTIPATGRAPYKGTFGSLDDHTVLPIELVSFTANCNGRSSLIEWTTATERNNDYFSLERSDDAINFTEIARVAGAGNSIEPLDYSYTDYGIHGGDNYYRLVQVDYDGTRTVSEIVVANCIEPEVGEPDVQAYPNPFSSDLTVVLDNFGNRAATIEIYDMLGKLIYTNKVAAPQNNYETILNLSNLPPAAYTVRVSTTDFVINRNVVKQ
ncbi:MAG: T9SS type A sorting domain-containing protein, partial [Bacteroidales bacterium]|nr:T9SS type A sorting domain-containing protein [Bacteroidales bacterium]